MFKMKMSLIAVVMSLALCVTVNAKEKSKVIRVACVGDSITEAGLIKDNQTYPTQLGKMLGDKYLVKNFGKSGASLLKNAGEAYSKTSEYKESLIFNPDIVLIMLGTNDSKRGIWKHQANFTSDYLALIKIYQELKSKPELFIVLPPPAFRGLYGINGKVIAEEIIPLTRAVAKKANLKIIDLNAVLVDKIKDPKNKKLLYTDGIHPTKAGATVIAETIAKGMLKK